SSNSCSFKSTNEFVTVVFNSRPWSKGMQYSLRMTNGGIYYLSEGSLASPEPLGAAPVLNRVGTLGMQSSFYRVSVDSSKQYKVSITPLEFADGSSFSFSASVVDLNDPFKEISACYGMEEGVNCHVESTTNEIRIAVSSSQYSRLGGNTSGGKFLLSVQEANVSFPSENKNLVEQDLPYEGSVGVRGSEYEIDLRPDVIYKVSFTQPEFEYVPLHLWVGNGLHSCFGSYWLPNEWYCYFVANEVQAARITVRPDNWRVGESTVVGSPFELNIVEAAEGEIKTSDGWGEYKTIPLNEDVSGYVGLGNANYQIDVEPNTNYQISLNYSSADIYVRVGSVVFGVEQKNACSIYSYLLRPSQCIITTGESEDRVYIEVEKNISQQAEFVINISAVVVD
ncbi:MAG: hypothetical protein OEX00_11200, partial [Gammaproteobacteria bacterium]|nr:hypothetical protein [Gammaproteobacteria bacterium]